MAMCDRERSRTGLSSNRRQYFFLCSTEPPVWAFPMMGFFLLLLCTNPPQFKKAPSKGHSLQKFCFLTVKKKFNCNSQALMVHYINQYPIVDDFLYSQYLSALQCIENVRRNYQMFITLRQDFTVLIFLRLRSGSPKLSL